MTELPPYRGVTEGQGIAMLTNRYFAALAFVGFLFCRKRGRIVARSSPRLRPLEQLVHAAMRRVE
jgi:hypothetical protein